MAERPLLRDLGGVDVYLAGSEGPAVVVLQEYWGVVPQICGLADRIAGAGFRVAVAGAPSPFAAAVAFYGERAASAALDRTSTFLRAHLRRARSDP
jgi:hypothetical protein